MLLCSRRKRWGEDVKGAKGSQHTREGAGTGIAGLGGGLALLAVAADARAGGIVDDLADKSLCTVPAGGGALALGHPLGLALVNCCAERRRGEGSVNKMERTRIQADMTNCGAADCDYPLWRRARRT